MSDLEEADAKITAWLQPLPDAEAPCGPDLEYDNDFLALTQAASGKPESQFGPAEPPDWRKASELAESLLDRSRDLRVAIHWLRAGLHLHGYAALPPGLRLLAGMVGGLWDRVHPLPDPDDNDPYGRVNALTLLREGEGLIGDLRSSPVLRDRAIGEIRGRDVELASGLADALADEAAPGLESLRQMMAAAVEGHAELAGEVQSAADEARRLDELVSSALGSAAPDLAPLRRLVDAVLALMPGAEPVAAGDGVDGAAQGEGGDARGLSGGVRSREEAIRAIDMICAYLERHEPTNPAPLFLRRARQLVGHNFLQLMKELAPGALPDVARMVGVDPESVETPGPP
jgi:type VI secretion system protein ImpA